MNCSIQPKAEYDNSLQERINKNLFLNNRKTNIAIVKIDNKIINNFWTYALVNHIGCNDIHDMFETIVDDQKSDNIFCKRNNVYIWYKVFIKAGNYTHCVRSKRNKSKQCLEYSFDTNYGIEINGCKYNTTNICNPCIDDNYTVFEMPRYLSIANITFTNISYRFRKYYVNCVNLHISNCIFNSINVFSIASIDTCILDKCVFADNTMFYVGAFQSYINFCITNSLCNTSNIMIDTHAIDKKSRINIIGNRIIGNYPLFYPNYSEANVSIIKNYIANTFPITRIAGMDIEFDLNYFSDIAVISEMGNFFGELKMNDNNIFVNCTDRLSKYAQYNKKHPSYCIIS